VYLLASDLTDNLRTHQTNNRCGTDSGWSLSVYANNRVRPTTNTIKKTRFGEIIKGMKMGGPYAFDEESSKRFYPLAIKIGFDLKDEDFSETETGFHFVVIRP
jgi:hypothetical protein